MDLKSCVGASAECSKLPEGDPRVHTLRPELQMGSHEDHGDRLASKLQRAANEPQFNSDLIDVVNVSHEERTPSKYRPWDSEVSPKTFSTPVSDRAVVCRFTPLCSPIVTSRRPTPPLSPDSSGYGSTSSRSSTRGQHSSHHSPAQSANSGCSGTQEESGSSPKFHENSTARRTVRDASPHSSTERILTQEDPATSQKNGRTTYTSAQVRALERVFVKNQYPEPDTVEELSREINVPCSKIKVWFQNKRARSRRRVVYPLPTYMFPHYAATSAISSGASLPGMPSGGQLQTTAMMPMVPYPSLYHSGFYACSPANSLRSYHGPSSMATALTYPEYPPLPYALSSLPGFHQQNVTRTDQSAMMYYPQNISYPAC